MHDDAERWRLSPENRLELLAFDAAGPDPARLLPALT
jgi:hypothetical protein